MLDILNRFLKSKGVSDPTKLDNSPNTDGSPTELQTFLNYEKTLSKDDLTLEDLKIFLTAQIGLIEYRWKSFDVSNEKKSELIPYHTVYKIIEQAISAPQSERAQLEAHLNNLLK